MKTIHLPPLIIGAFLFFFATVIFVPATVQAHCDTLAGPVVQAARTALDQGDVTPVLKWVRAEDEDEIRRAFTRTLSVRSKDAETRDLADLYFFETLVRIHRAGEGAPYTGLEPAAAVDPAVVLADRALENGSVDKLSATLTHALATGLQTRFQETVESSKHADESVEAGREFVRNYVVFTHYVEGLHTLIRGQGHHGGEAGQGDAGHRH